MNEGQERFYQFILERVMEGKKEEAKTLLLEGFEKQGDGTFDANYLAGYQPKMIALLKEECVEEVKGVMNQFNAKQG